jgi:hypothetical protein
MWSGRASIEASLEFKPSQGMCNLRKPDNKDFGCIQCTYIYICLSNPYSKFHQRMYEEWLLIRIENKVFDYFQLWMPISFAVFSTFGGPCGMEMFPVLRIISSVVEEMFVTQNGYIRTCFAVNFGIHKTEDAISISVHCCVLFCAYWATMSIAQEGENLAWKHIFQIAGATARKHSRSQCSTGWCFGKYAKNIHADADQPLESKEDR